MIANYTQEFSVAYNLVAEFVKEEIRIVPNKNSDEEEWLKNFFNFNLCQLEHDAVVNQIKRMMLQGGTDNVPYNAALARVKALYSKVFMAVGRETMTEIESNLIASIVNLIDPSRKNKAIVRKIQAIISTYPLLVISALGNDTMIVARASQSRYVERTKKLAETLTNQKSPSGSLTQNMLNIMS